MAQNTAKTENLGLILLGAISGLASLAILFDLWAISDIYSAILGVIAIALLASAFMGGRGSSGGRSGRT